MSAPSIWWSSLRCSCAASTIDLTKGESLMTRSVLGILVAAAWLVASSCAPASAPTAAQPVSPTPPPPTKMIVAYSNISPTIMPLWVAKDTGIFEKHGLDVDLQYVA